MAAQYALDSWASTFMYAFIGQFGGEAVSAYGVADSLTGAGGSFGLALYTATSIRVGTLLGENVPGECRRC